jgi:archaellum biogenesis ATPase FlaH
MTYFILFYLFINFEIKSKKFTSERTVREYISFMQQYTSETF